MPQVYRAAPITEAVLEFQFSSPISLEAAERDRALNFTLDAATGSSRADPLWEGFRHSSVDRAELSIIRTVAFACSRLAPYTGWVDFSARVRRDWEIIRKDKSIGDLARVGIRYINRIDVPSASDEVHGINDYLNIFPVMPETRFGSINSYLMQISRNYGTEGLAVVINCATAASPLPNYSALFLDIDVSLSGQIPRKDQELWDLLETMRACKNDVFEECITDRTRELIG